MMVMRITLNGETREISEACTVRDLLEASGLGNAACAVEINRELVPHRQYDEHCVRDGDQIEIVTLVGGG